MDVPNYGLVLPEGYNLDISCLAEKDCELMDFVESVFVTNSEIRLLYEKVNNVDIDFVKSISFSVAFESLCEFPSCRYENPDFHEQLQCGSLLEILMETCQQVYVIHSCIQSPYKGLWWCYQWLVLWLQYICGKKWFEKQNVNSLVTNRFVEMTKLFI